MTDYTSDFDFDLPKDLIAVRPMSPREEARLCILNDSNRVCHKKIYDLPDFIKENDVIVYNNTKVLQANISGYRVRTNVKSISIDVTLLKSLTENNWQCFIKPSKKLDIGDVIDFTKNNNQIINATVLNKNSDGSALLRFNLNRAEILTALSEIGTMPLPPYIRSLRETDEQDISDYQPVFAQYDGSVASPTASLHLTENLIEILKNKGVIFTPVTLHVGAGTFLPVKTDLISDHKIHSEYGLITQETADCLNKAKADGRKIFAIGTTSLRLIETSIRKSGIFEPFAGETDIFLKPPETIHSADYLFTNFHFPKSTLFMLVCAFCGTQKMKFLYQEAIEQHYRFFSYGDACLLQNFSKS